MNKTRPLFVVATLGLVTLFGSIASAQSPGDLYNACLRKISETTKRCKNAVADEATECIPKIKRLLNNGNRVRARHVADQCVDDINAIVRKCIDELKDTCERCANALRKMGAYDLAEKIKTHCRRAANAMIETRDRAVSAIRDLFS